MWLSVDVPDRPVIFALFYIFCVRGGSFECGGPVLDVLLSIRVIRDYFRLDERYSRPSSAPPEQLFRKWTLTVNAT